MNYSLTTVQKFNSSSIAEFGTSATLAAIQCYRQSQIQLFMSEVKEKLEDFKSSFPTIGETRVRVKFNPSDLDIVSQIKQDTAKLINLLQAVRNDEASKTYDKSPEEMRELSGEKLRLIALAQTSYEEAAMWAVKAATT